jgi:hypothetical protein
MLKFPGMNVAYSLRKQRPDGLILDGGNLANPGLMTMEFCVIPRCSDKVPLRTVVLAPLMIVRVGLFLPTWSANDFEPVLSLRQPSHDLFGISEWFPHRSWARHPQELTSKKQTALFAMSLLLHLVIQ